MISGFSFAIVRHSTVQHPSFCGHVLRTACANFSIVNHCGLGVAPSTCRPTLVSLHLLRVQLLDLLHHDCFFLALSTGTLPLHTSAAHRFLFFFMLLDLIVFFRRTSSSNCRFLMRCLARYDTSCGIPHVYSLAALFGVLFFNICQDGLQISDAFSCFILGAILAFLPTAVYLLRFLYSLSSVGSQ